MLFGAGLLGLCTLAICVAHDRLTHALIAPLLATDVEAPARFATVIASLLVHLATGIWVLPRALRLTRFGLSADAVRVAIYSAVAMVFLRTGVEAGTGLLLQGLPFVSVCAALTALAVLRSRTRVAAQARPVLRAIIGGRAPAQPPVERHIEAS